MAPNYEPTYSQCSTSSSSGSSSSDYNVDDIIVDVPSRLTTPNYEIEYTLVELFKLYKIVDAYLKEKRALESIQVELDIIVKLV